jgi:hypothetical protein
MTLARVLQWKIRVLRSDNGGEYCWFLFILDNERYSMYYYNNECSIYREHKVTIHERMRPLNNQ